MNVINLFLIAKLLIQIVRRYKPWLILCLIKDFSRIKQRLYLLAADYQHVLALHCCCGKDVCIATIAQLKALAKLGYRHWKIAHSYIGLLQGTKCLLKLTFVERAYSFYCKLSAWKLLYPTR